MTKLFDDKDDCCSGGEWHEWYRMTPAERWAETDTLWTVYLELGGSLDPEPDTQSPFHDAHTWRSPSLDGRAGVQGAASAHCRLCLLVTTAQRLGAPATTGASAGRLAFSLYGKRNSHQGLMFKKRVSTVWTLTAWAVSLIMYYMVILTA